MHRNSLVILGFFTLSIGVLSFQNCSNFQAAPSTTAAMSSTASPTSHLTKDVCEQAAEHTHCKTIA
jgi:hypothetical protein